MNNPKRSKVHLAIQASQLDNHQLAIFEQAVDYICQAESLYAHGAELEVRAKVLLRQLYYDEISSPSGVLIKTTKTRTNVNIGKIKLRLARSFSIPTKVLSEIFETNSKTIQIKDAVWTSNHIAKESKAECV